MKHTTHLTLTPAPVPSAIVPAAAGATTTIHCVNLRPADHPSRLVPVGAPSVVAAAGWRPLLRTTGGDESYLIVERSRLLAAVAADGTITEIGQAPARVDCATCDTSGHVLVMTAAAAISLTHTSSGWTMALARPDYPAVRIRTVTGPLLSTTTPLIQLRGTYTAPTRIIDADRRAITSVMTEAYDTIDRTARAAGLFFQPVLARYRLLDNRGNSLFEGPVSLVGAEQGCQLTQSWSVCSADRTVMPSISVAARSWSLQLDIEQGMPSHVAAIELELSPRFHPIDPSCQAMVEVVRRTDSEEFLRVAMPGVEVTATTAAVVRSAVGRFEIMARKAATVYGPFRDDTLLSVPLTIACGEAYTTEIASLRASLRLTPQRPDYLTGRLASPHRFTATTVAQSSGVTLWGDLTVGRFDGYRIGALSASTVEGPWRGAVTVTMADGTERVIASTQALDHAPATFGPVLSYPSPDARTMQIMLWRTGTSPVKGTYQLQPDESGRRAIYVAPDLRPFELPVTTGSYVVPAASTAPIHLPSMLAAASAERPLDVTAVAMPGAARPVGIVAAALTQTVWNFGRTRFYTYGSDGIICVTVSSGIHSLAVNRVKAAPVARADAACMLGGTLYVLSASGDILAVQQTRADVIVSHTEAIALAACEARGELWAIMPDGSAQIFMPGRRMTSYRRPPAGYAGAFCRDGDELVTGTCGLCNLANETIADTTAVAWTAAISPHAPARQRLSALRPHLSASQSTLSIAVSSNSPTNPPFISWRVTGAVRSPLTLPVMIGAPLHTSVITIGGTVSPDFSFDSLILSHDS